MGDRIVLGKWGEAVASEFLIEAGMEIVARNWRCRHGEVDIIAADGATLVFCEVKTRSALGFGTPLTAITASKLLRLRRLVGLYLVETGGHRGSVRIDAIGVLAGGAAQIVHVRGVG
jgi:putative endonuclease